MQMLMKTSWRTDLDPADFFLLPILKNTSKEHIFQDIEEIKGNVTRQPRGIKQNSFQEALQKWNTRWKRSIAREGDQLEGTVYENEVS